MADTTGVDVATPNIATLATFEDREKNWMAESALVWGIVPYDINMLYPVRSCYISYSLMVPDILMYFARCTLYLPGVQLLRLMITPISSDGETLLIWPYLAYLI